MGQEGGFTIVEVMVASVVLIVGLGALMEMLITADHVISNTRLRQEETSIAREVLEDARGLSYSALIQSSMASSLQSVVPGSTVSGSTLVVTRSISPSTASGVSFNVTFTECSLDSPSDGYGDHTSAPLSGGSWCSDVASSGTTDSNPDDYKRISVTVTPQTKSTPTVQQTILIYQLPQNGPAVSCLSTTTSCPGSNVTVTSGSSLTFNVTTTSTAARVQWLVNGNTPSTSQIGGGGVDPYAPTTTSSTFTWTYPTTTYNGTTYTIDGTYTITAVAYDAEGNSGTRSTLQVTVNEHTVLPPSAVTAGWNDLMGGVDVQWLPSVDQDVQYYQVWHKYGALPAVQVATCGTSGNVSGTSCTDTSAVLSAEQPPATALRPTCLSPQQSYTTTDYYYVVGWDKDPTTGLARASTFSSPQSDANLCNHQPNAPTGLTATASGSTIQLSWTAPSPGDPDTGDSIQDWRIYRWASGGWTDPGSRYQLIGTSASSPVTSYTDTSPDPSGVTQKYCVTAVDTRLDESACSNVVTG